MINVINFYYYYYFLKKNNFFIFYFFSDELLLQDDGPELSNMTMEFNKGMRISQSFAPAESFTGVGRYNQMPNSNMSSQRHVPRHHLLMGQKNILFT